MEGFGGFVFFITLVGWIVSFASKVRKASNGGVSNKDKAEARQRFEEKLKQLETLREQQIDAANRPFRNKSGDALSDITKLRMQRQEQLIAQGRLKTSAANAVKSTEKPIVEHSTDDCTGGSIHDGYHEGTIRRPAPASSAEGVQGAQGRSDNMITHEDAAMGEPLTSSVNPFAEGAARTVSATRTSGADKLSKAIADKPAIVQGLIWSEVLSRPLSDN